MKKYSDLTSLQKDFAVDKALIVLVKMLISDSFEFQFKSPLAQWHFYNALSSFKKDEDSLKAILDSDEIAEELYPIAESMAETAYYPIAGEYVLEDIAG